MFRKIDETISVSPQIEPDDVARAAAEGFTLIVNNRPDGEQPGQPPAATIEAAAGAAGLDYVAIPITPGGFGAAEVAAMRSALAGAKGPVLAFCRSGTRSTFLWALARAGQGEDADALTAKAAAAGYDLTPLRGLL